MDVQCFTAVFVFFVTYSSISVYCAYTPTMETEIRNEIVFNASYDAVSRPTEVTHVDVGINILAIDELNLKGQKLTVAGWLTLEWTDDRLTWDYTTKNDMKHIFTKPAFIWKPELLVDNSLAKLGVITDTSLLTRISYSGSVEWETPLSLTTHCEVDITFYPYDRQHCSIEIVSWGYTIDEVSLGHLYNTINMEDFVTHGEWIVEHTSVEDRNLTEHQSDGTVRIYPRLDFWLYLKRRTDFYNLNVMMPVILTSLMVGLVFIVPIDSGEKVSYVLTVFLSMAVLLTIVSDTLPPTSITTSILGVYLAIVLVSAAFGILLTVLILILFHKDGCPKRSSLIVTLTRYAAKCICWQFPTTQPNIEGDSDLRKVTPIKTFDANDSGDELDERVVASYDEANDITWSRVAQILDRFCFFVFFSVNVLMNVSFVVVLSTGDGSI